MSPEGVCLTDGPTVLSVQTLDPVSTCPRHSVGPGVHDSPPGPTVAPDTVVVVSFLKGNEEGNGK